MVFLPLVLAPVTLRYKHTPGQKLRLQVTDTLDTLIAPKGAELQLIGRRQSNVKMQRTVTSVEGSTVVLEERVLEGTAVEETSSGRRTVAVPETLRRITINNRGVTLKTEHVEQPGIPAGRSGFLDGLSLPLPPGPASAGTEWIETQQVKGPDAKPMKMQISLKWVSDEKRQERQCIRFRGSFQGTYLPSDKEGKPAGQGRVSGEADYWFDPKAQQDVEMELKLTVETTTQSSPPSRAVTRWTMRQVVQQR
jgi:hypothetical protein